MKRIVIKIGSSSLVDDFGKLDNVKINNLVKEISLLKKDNIMPILVSSGAIAVGRSILNIKPQTIAEKQAKELLQERANKAEKAKNNQKELSNLLSFRKNTAYA